jgi:hypothetical protein
MAVSNPWGNIPHDHTPELSLAHIAKKGDRRFAPLSPYDTAGQSTERLLQLLNRSADRNDAG